MCTSPECTRTGALAGGGSDAIGCCGARAKRPRKSKTASNAPAITPPAISRPSSTASSYPRSLGAGVCRSSLRLRYRRLRRGALVQVFQPFECFREEAGLERDDVLDAGETRMLAHVREL